MATSATPVQLVDPATGNPYSAQSGTGTSADQVQGNVAAAATDSGNPVKIGGIYQSTLPTLTNGQRGNVQVDRRGILYTQSVGSRTYITGQVTVGTTATQIVAAKAERSSLIITATAATAFYVGANSVTTGTGLYVPAGGSITLDTSDAVYAVVSAATLVVSYLETY
jgi:hypothetical protein